MPQKTLMTGAATVKKLRSLERLHAVAEPLRHQESNADLSTTFLESKRNSVVPDPFAFYVDAKSEIELMNTLASTLVNVLSFLSLVENEDNASLNENGSNYSAS